MLHNELPVTLWRLSSFCPRIIFCFVFLILKTIKVIPTLRNLYVCVYIHTNTHIHECIYAEDLEL